MGFNITGLSATLGARAASYVLGTPTREIARAATSGAVTVKVIDYDGERAVDFSKTKGVLAQSSQLGFEGGMSSGDVAFGRQLEEALSADLAEAGLPAEKFDDVKKAIGLAAKSGDTKFTVDLR